MKLFKSLLLASATGLVAVSGASAADLGAKKPSPVEYVKACYNPLWGTAGGFVIPGSNTCLRISGRVRADYIYAETFTRSQDTFGWRTRAIINMDAITQTEIGPVRSFFSLFFQGDRGSISGGNIGTAGSAANFAAAGNAGSNLSVDKAFVQFAGITAGRAQSFFDFSGNFSPSYNFTVGLGSENGTTNMLAYTLPLGSTGASFTVSLEDPSTRRTTSATFANGIAYAGQRMPDVVGSLDLNQAWGSFKLSGAVHQIIANNLVPAAVNPARPYVGTTYGYAIQGAVKVNLPMIAAGDYLWLQAAYAEGAINYLGGFSGGVNHGPIALSNADAYIDAFGGVKKTKGFTIDAGFVHFWTPTVRQWIVGTYKRLDYSAAIETPIALGAGARISGGVTDATVWRIGTGLQWNLAPGLFVGAEVNYLVADPKGRMFVNPLTNVSPLKTVSSTSAWEGRLRIQRDF